MTPLVAWPRTGYLPVVSPIPEPDPPDEPDPPTTPAPAAWVDHPDVEHTINQMLVSGGRIVLAHGAWTGGNHHIAWVNLDGTPGTGPRVPSEGFQVVRRFGDTIFLPWQDPTGAWNAAQGYSCSTDDGATWQDKRVAPAAHFFDLRESDGTLYLAGSGAGYAAVWASADGGHTWVESVRHDATGAPRFVQLVEAAGTLWCRATSQDAPAYRLTSGQWEQTAAPVPAGDGYGFGLSAQGVAYGVRSAFDGERVVDYSTEVRGPSWADATHVYAVNQGSGTIDRAAHLTAEDAEVTWGPWLDLGEGMTGHVATTAVLHDSHVYVGGTQGRIWRLTLP